MEMIENAYVFEELMLLSCSRRLPAAPEMIWIASLGARLHFVIGSMAASSFTLDEQNRIQAPSYLQRYHVWQCYQKSSYNLHDGCMCTFMNKLACSSMFASESVLIPESV